MSAEAVKAAAAEVHGPPAASPAATEKPESAQARANKRWFQNSTATVKPVDRDFDTVTLKQADILHGASLEANAEVTISEETVKKYTNFLESYTTNLGKLAEIPDPADPSKSMYDRIINDPTGKFGHDKLLMQMVGTQVVGEDGKTITRGMDDAKVKAFLTSSDGFAITTQLMEQYSLMTNVGLGMHATIDSQYFKRQHPLFGRDADDPTKTRKSTIHRYPTLGRGLKVAALKSWSGLKVAGFFVGGPGATNIRNESDIDLLRGIKAATNEEKAYLKAMVGIDVDQIRIAPGTNIPEYKDGYKPDVNTLLQRNTDSMRAREGFLTEVGLDPRRIRLPEEFIFDDDTQTEGLTLRYYQEMMDIYGQIGTGGTNYEKTQRMAEARSKVMIRYSERMIALEKAGNGEKVIVSLEEKIKKMKENPEELRTERRKELEESDKVATERKTEMQKRKDAISTGPDSLAAKAQAAAALEAQLYQEFGFSPDNDLETEIATKLTALETSRDTAQTAYEGATDKKAEALEKYINDIREQVRKSQEDIANAIRTGSSSIKGGIPPQEDLKPTYDLVERTVATRHDPLIARQQAALTKAEGEYTKLKTLQEQYRTASQAKEQAARSLSADAPGQIQKSTDAYTEFTTTLSLTPDQIRKNSVADLTALLTTGTDEEKLEKALLAKTEVDALTEESIHPIPSYQDAAIVNIAAFGVQVDELVSSNYTDLFTRLRASGMAEADVKAALPAAIKGAERKFSNRYFALSEQGIAHYDSILEANKKERETITDFKEPIALIELTVSTLSSSDAIYSRIAEVVTDDDKRDALFDFRAIKPNDDTFTPAERSLGATEAYFAWLQILRPNLLQAIDRDAQVATLVKIFPPDALRKAIRKRFPVGVRASISSSDIQPMVSDMLAYLKDRSLAA